MACKEIGKPFICTKEGLKYGGKRPSEIDIYSFNRAKLIITSALLDVPIQLSRPDVHGDQDGETDFVRYFECIEEEPVSLTAPNTWMGYTFSWWVVDGYRFPYGQTTVNAYPRECNQAHAVYGISENGCSQLLHCVPPVLDKPNWAPPVCRVEIVDLFTVAQSSSYGCITPQSVFIQKQAERVFNTHTNFLGQWAPGNCLHYFELAENCYPQGGCNGGSSNGCLGADCLCLVNPTGVPCSEEAFNLPCCGGQRSRVDWDYVPVPPPPAQCPDVYSAYQIDWDNAGVLGMSVGVNGLQCVYNPGLGEATISFAANAFVQADYMTIGCGNIGCFPMENESFGVNCSSVSLASPAPNQPIQEYPFTKTFFVGEGLEDCEACELALISAFSPLELPLEYTDQFSSCRRYFYKMRIWL